MKPRLKLSITGRLVVLRPSVMDWRASDAKRRITLHYGSMSAFASRFGFRYWQVINALCTDGDNYISAAGGIAEVRQVLGLPSVPSKVSIAQVKAKEERRQKLIAPAPHTQSVCAPDSLIHTIACAAECPSASGCGGVGTRLDRAHV